MNKTSYQSYLGSPWWRSFREGVYARANWTCSACRKTGVPLNVHHLSYARLGREAPEDVVCLCRSCHLMAHESDSLRGLLRRLYNVLSR